VPNWFDEWQEFKGRVEDEMARKYNDSFYLSYYEQVKKKTPVNEKLLKMIRLELLERGLINLEGQSSNS